MPTNFLAIEPMAYHLEMVQYLKMREEAIWKWYSSDRLRSEQNEAARLELLKSTYRIERSANERLYANADEVCAKLGLSAPVTFYQSQDVGGLNVSVRYIPGEVHVILFGAVATALEDLELKWVLGHELLHFALLENWREYLTAWQVLAAMANDAAATTAHHNSWRLFALYSEVYCDRAGLALTQDVSAAITALAKIETGVTGITAESYLRQMDEIFSKGLTVSDGVDHPESFIRAKALTLWAEKGPQAAGEIALMIEGPLSVGSADLLAQVKLCDLTRRLIEQILIPHWMQTETAMAHARLFFDDFHPATHADATLKAALATDDAKLRDYWCYVLLDFAVVDRDLEDAPLAAMLMMADDLGLGDRFRVLAAKELNLRKKQMESLDADAATLARKAAEAADQP
ncbi:MAG: hypothetical protein ABFD92_10970 [Planctomycetaceae bacterium]|nr:hypothetical protein [Planctomycetaceae bacterium]